MSWYTIKWRFIFIVNVLAMKTHKRLAKLIAKEFAP